MLLVCFAIPSPSSGERPLAPGSVSLAELRFVLRGPTALLICSGRAHALSAGEHRGTSQGLPPSLSGRGASWYENPIRRLCTFPGSSPPLRGGAYARPCCFEARVVSRLARRFTLRRSAASGSWSCEDPELLGCQPWARGPSFAGKNRSGPGGNTARVSIPAHAESAPVQGKSGPR